MLAGVDVAMIGLALSVAGLVFKLGQNSQRLSVVERDVNSGFTKVAAELNTIHYDLKELDSKLDACNIAIAKNSKA